MRLLRYGPIATYGSLLALIIAGLLWVHHSDQVRSRQICGLVLALDDSYRETPPVTVVGKNVAEQLHAYRLKLGC